MENNKNKWTGFKLLHEEVSSVDGFKHKTHQEVADSLAEIIINDNQGATVGIEGSWGGGKSTVINILKRKLKGKAFLFLFDAWAHEEDCLRRVFLETLVENVQKAIESKELNGDEEGYKKLYESIDGRFKTSNTKTTRRPTSTGIATVIFGFLSAVGMTLWQMAVNEGEVVNDAYFQIGYVLTISPAICVFMWALLHPGRVKDIFKLKFWSFLDTNSTNETTQEVSEDSERSSVEFARYFSYIMSSLANDNPELKFLIAIDNLDRIEGSRSLALWSTLQTFLQKRSGEIAEDWFKKMWVLVPYDAQGLEKVWTLDDEKGGKAKAKSFMDKAFQVRVEVPRPVMTDWEDFAEDMAAELLDSSHSTDAQDIVRVLKVTRNALSNIPTPREIKNYLNQVAVFRNQFCKEIETKTIAYYVIKRFVDEDRMSVDEIREKLLWKEFPLQQDMPYLPENVAEQLAGIVFSVSPKDGQQLLLEPSIADALENYNVEDFRTIIANHEDGAWMAFDSYVKRIGLWKDASDIRKFLTSASCVFENDCDDFRLRTFADVCRDYISRLCADDPENLKSFFDADDDQLEIAVSAIKGLTHLLGTRPMARLNHQLADTLEAIVAHDEMENLQLGKSASQLFEAFAVESKKKSIIKTFTADKLRQLCSSLPKLKYNLAKWIVPLDSIVTEINATIRQDAEIPPFLGRAVKYLIESGVKIDWSDTIDAVEQHIRRNNGHTNDRIPTRRALDILLFVVGANGKENKYIERIGPLLRTGAYYNFVAGNIGERAKKAALLLMCCDYKLCSNVQPTNHIGSSQNGVAAINAVLNSESDEEVKIMLDAINEFGVEGRLREFTYQTRNRIFGAMVRYGMEHEEYAWFNLNKEDPLDAIWLYSEHLKVSDIEDKKDKLHSYMDYLNDKYESVSKLKDKGFSDQDFEYCSEFIHYYLTRNFDVLKGRVISDLNKLSEGNYFSVLSEPEFRSLLRLLNGHGCKGYLGIEYYKGLHKLLTGEADSSKERDEFVAEVNSGEMGILVAAMNPIYMEPQSKDLVGTIEGMIKTENNKVRHYYEVVGGVCQIGEFTDRIIDSLAWEGSVNGAKDLLVVAADLIKRNKVTSDIWVPSDEEKRKMSEPLEKIYRDTEDPHVQDAIKIVAQYYCVELPSQEEPSDESDDSPAGE